jgi:D-alanine-D-alanine ligase
MNILILQGGDSPEREVSLASAKAVAEAAETAGYNVQTYDTINGFNGMLPLLEEVDLVFPVLHGSGGEDGEVQEFLEKQSAKFVGAGALSSKLCFDKIASKKALEAAGLPTPKWQEVNRESLARSLLARRSFVLKPIAGGSSVDTFIIKNPQNEKVDLSVFDRYETMLLEEMVEGTELTVGILGEDALPPVEIIPPEGGVFDYENKYNGKTKELCPPKSVSKNLQSKAQELALKTRQTLGAKDFSRVDLMLDKTGNLYILEINTIPGMTNQSLFPKEARAAGITMPELVNKLIKMSVPDPNQPN